VAATGLRPVGVSDGLHLQQPNNRLRSTISGSNARVAIPNREDAPAESKPILDNVDKMLGFVPNQQRLVPISPNAFFGRATLMGSLAKTMNAKTTDGIAFAARANQH
jgi:hypothetical protein